MRHQTGRKDGERSSQHDLPSSNFSLAFQLLTKAWALLLIREVDVKEKLDRRVQFREVVLCQQCAAI